MSGKLLSGRKHYMRESEPLLPPVSRTFARRVFYASCFFYASFFLHGYAIYSVRAEETPPPAPRAETCFPGKGVLEPVLRALLPAADVAPVASAADAKGGER